MKLIQLTKGLVCKVDDADFEFLSQWKWTAHFDRGRWYARRQTRVNGHRQQILMHRVILNAPTSVQIDHWNHDGLDNQRGNLRTADYSQNGMNRLRISNSTGFKGVKWHRNRVTKPYEARIKKRGKSKYLGCFDTPQMAAQAYNAAAACLFGEWACPNVISHG